MPDVRIYQPTKTAMQSGRANIKKWVLEFEPGSPKETDTLMGWTGSRDTNGQVRMRFASKEDAVAFAQKHKLTYQVSDPKKRRIKPKAYSDNFAFGRNTLWNSLMRAYRVVALTGALALVLGATVAQASFLDKLKDAAKEATSSTSSGGSTAGAVSSLSQSQIIAGLKDALRVGTERVVAQLGAKDGFNADPAIHIPLPDSLKSAQSMLRKAGLSSLADDVELKINRAAEEATPKAKALLWKAVEGMTVDDAKAIYNGPKDAATQYFRRVTGSDLKAAVAPVVERALNEVGAVTSYDALISKYKALPFVPNVKDDLKEHATTKALDGIFHYLATEEAAIRANPAARTTDILKTVFGAK